MGCMYCDKGERLASAAYKISDLSVSELYLFREQSYPGRVVLVLNRHAEELHELTEEERTAFIGDLCRVTAAMGELFHPDKINCGMFGDTVKHLHVHIVPKKEGGLDWNSIFQMNPRSVYLSEEEYEQMASQYRAALNG